MTQSDENVIHKSVDEFGELLIKEEGLIRTLYFGSNNKQSCVFLPDPSTLVLQYAQAMTSVLLFNEQPKKILIIGLGGGSLLNFFLKACPEAQIHVIELRESVIRLSHDFFQVPENEKNVRIICADAKEYVENLSRNKSQEYDFILVDAFDAWGPAELNNDDNFIISCQMLLKIEGVICFNLWNRKEDDFYHISDYFSALFSGNILKMRLEKRNSNVIILCFSQEQKAKEIHKAKLRALDLNEQLGIDYIKLLKILKTQNFTGLERLTKYLSA